jgi:NAD(P)-dependent dehydrogenase (short-subunit alcohol dehydrogenase family)
MSSNEKVWVVTGAGRGLGADIVRAALAAGHKVVATGRDPAKLDAVLGAHDKLRTLKLDITDADDANVGGSFCTGYAAGKFAVEGWMESLAPEIEPFGIQTMLVEPGFFRTELLSAGSTTFAKPSIDDYADRTAGTIAFLSGLDGKQPGDPVKLASALVQLAALNNPPLRFVAGTDAMEPIAATANALLAQIDAHRALSASLATQAQET